MIRQTLQKVRDLNEPAVPMRQDGNNSFESLGKIKPKFTKDYVDPWRLDPDPYGYHGIDLERRLTEMQLLPEDLL